MARSSFWDRGPRLDRGPRPLFFAFGDAGEDTRSSRATGARGPGKYSLFHARFNRVPHCVLFVVLL